MRTVSFRELKVGHSPSRVLLDLDSARDGVVLTPGLTLIVAPNGLGKTTFLQTVAGVRRPISGEVRIGDTRLRPERDVLYVSEFLSFPKFIYPSEWVEFLAGSDASSSDWKSWAERFRLREELRRYLGRLSQGERRKVTWLAAHASRKPVQLLDEPLDGLDLLAIDSAREMLRTWKKEGRMTCVVAHQVSELMDLADQVLLVRDRKFVPFHDKNTGPQEFRSKMLEFYGPLA